MGQMEKYLFSIEDLNECLLVENDIVIYGGGKNKRNSCYEKKRNRL